MTDASAGKKILKNYEWRDEEESSCTELDLARLDSSLIVK